ncbi:MULTISPECIES: HAD-IA family hydrolase [Cyanophyceae]|uniref:HAD-IA family hydrolase n=1 Tax=Cyanophyceae TaxID=3028117 RepID=UPI0016844587|nr:MULTISPECIES: HAD-IA family hydrolase [Cyanophyceae]MBD1917096.1 HAD-IA family hydrolase [Phormidium sp. FACHB-77]MBD2030627.1 HAD-IA family hydrolase [Phormidium sp. FACHB-322]MBD2050265.1 HAD-IA family hydrolase [Leptolyngbya sp. FACHB-60]
MKTLEALIFDVDGTLAETERDGHRVAFNQAFQEFGLLWHWPVGLYGQLLRVAGGKERIRHYIQRYQPKFEAEDIDELVVALHEAKAKHFQALVENHVIPLRPGVRRLIVAAQRQGVRLAIATTSAKDSVIPLLEHLLGPDSPSWFEMIAAGDMVPTKKPAPDIYELIINAMALNPNNCLVIEDSQQGLEAATAAGLTTVVTINDYTRYHVLDSARLVVNHLGEPNLPFKVLRGKANNAYYFSLDLAQTLLPPQASTPG